MVDFWWVSRGRFVLDFTLYFPTYLGFAELQSHERVVGVIERPWADDEPLF